MTPEQQLQEFLQMFGPEIPDPEHCPRQFAYLVRLYRFEKKIQQQNNKDSE
jgi:hypothetical protein